MSSNLTSRSPAADETEQPQRALARKELEARRKFRADLFAYVVVNLFFVGAWAVTGAGYFWPGWVLAGWGVLLLLDFWNVYLRRPITEQDIDEHLRGGRS